MKKQFMVFLLFFVIGLDLILLSFILQLLNVPSTDVVLGAWLGLIAMILVNYNLFKFFKKQLTK
jgi:hypothetical protein